MENLCDLYIPIEHKINVPEIRFLELFDKSFKYDENKLYQGFVGVNIVRIQLLRVVLELKKEGVVCLNVPIRYRDNPTIDLDQAYSYAKQYADSKNYEMGYIESEGTPLYWTFGLYSDDLVGGRVMVDKIDGHIWSGIERMAYQYDYNHILP